MNQTRHATIEELLEILDGKEHPMADHVRSCPVCQRELNALRCLRRDLYELADEPAPADMWQRISASVAAQGVSEDDPTQFDLEHHDRDQFSLSEEKRGVGNSAGNSPSAKVPVELLIANGQAANQNSLSRAIYTLAASVVFTGFIGLYLIGRPDPVLQQNQLLQANIQELMLNSRGMERALQRVAMQSELLTPSDRSRADRLYWQLSYLDQQIHDKEGKAEQDPVLLEALWNDRVEALTELNQLYYQRQRALDDSEI